MSSDTYIRETSKVCSSHNVVKILASIFQLLYASYTLIAHRGNQMDRWGYASFSLAVIPYALMSFINGISNLAAPDYPTLYMIHSNIMNEAIEAGGAFEGVMGRTIPLPETTDLGLGSGFGEAYNGVTLRAIRQAISLESSSRSNSKRRAGQLRQTLTVTANLQAGGDRNLQDATLTLAQKGEFSACLRSFKIKAEPVGFFSSLYTSLRRGDKISLKRLLFKNLARPDASGALTPACSRLVSSFPFLWAVARKYHQERCSLKNLWNLRLPPGTQISKKRLTTILYPACSRFLRQDDPLLPSSGSRDNKDGEDVGLTTLNRWHAIFLQFLCGTALAGRLPLTNDHRPENGITWVAIVVQLILGLSISSLTFALIGLLSGFQPGHSSTTERAIMMTWLNSGIGFGLLMPFFSILDLAKILVLSPWYSLTVVGARSPSLSIPYLGFIPWAIFIPPVWSLVLVSIMLKEWGSCVTLF
jgi:hypothetical protein